METIGVQPRGEKVPFGPRDQLLWRSRPSGAAMAAEVPMATATSSDLVLSPSVGPGDDTRRSHRPDLDNLKVALTVGVITTHAILTYADAGDWFYQEKDLGDLAAIVVLLPGLLGALFAMGLFFLIAGWFSPRALERKGPRRFAVDRLVKLGLPLVVAIVVITPFVNALVAYQTEDISRPVLPFHRHLVSHLDTGPLWFVAVLLVFSLGYVALRSAFPRHPVAQPSGPLRARHLVALASFVAAASFVVRLQFSMDSHQVMNLHVFQWPQYLALFSFGVLAHERGWLHPVPDRIRRGCGWATVVGVLALPVLMGLGGAFAEDATVDPFAGGLRWESLGTAVIEGVLAVSASIWMLGWFGRRWNHQGVFARELARSAYGAFIVQTPVLVTIALALRRLDVAPELRLLVLAPTAVVTCFALSWLAVEAWHVCRLPAHPAPPFPA